jgi:DNA-binding transcriptional LysR family regulator
MRVSFRQLAHARALASHGNFRLAAAELHISQPALTRSIKALEASLATQLFDRLSSGVVLTPAGEVLLERGRRVLREGEDMERALADFLGLGAGSLVVSTGPYPGDALVPDAMSAVIRHAPDISCRIREADWTEVPRHLLNRESDLAVADLSEVMGDDRFTTELLINDYLFFICRSQHPLAGKAQVSNTDFARYPLVGNRVPEHIGSLLVAPGIASSGRVSAGPFQVKIDVATFAATRRIVLASDGVTLATLGHVESELLAGSMTVLNTGKPVIRLHSGLIQLKDRSLSPAAEQFVRELRRIKAEMDSRAAALAGRFGLV